MRVSRWCSGLITLFYYYVKELHNLVHFVKANIRLCGHPFLQPTNNFLTFHNNSQLTSYPLPQAGKPRSCTRIVYPKDPCDHNVLTECRDSLQNLTTFIYKRSIPTCLHNTLLLLVNVPTCFDLNYWSSSGKFYDISSACFT